MEVDLFYGIGLCSKSEYGNGSGLNPTVSDDVVNLNTEMEVAD